MLSIHPHLESSNAMLKGRFNYTSWAEQVR